MDTTQNRFNWTRKTSLSAQNRTRELWTCNGPIDEKSYWVDVTLGKKTDVLGMKARAKSEFESHIKKQMSERNKLFSGKLELLENCPICNFSTKTASRFLSVQDIHYIQCSSCDHVFVQTRPTKESLEAYYTENDIYQSTYTDKKAAKKRILEICKPKLDWAVNQYTKVYGTPPKKILDVGAGSGHFVKCCRDAGFPCEGLECSNSGRKFSKDLFGVDLLKYDFLSDSHPLGDFDLITLWGVIEHTVQPLDFLKKAAAGLSKNGMVVVEVPKADSLSTSIQRKYSDSVVRHMEPLGHIHGFTDSSLATSFSKSGLIINAVWYFGMDFYELGVQFSHESGNPKNLSQFSRIYGDLQDTIDQARIGDALVMAGVNKK